MRALLVIAVMLGAAGAEAQGMVPNPGGGFNGAFAEGASPTPVSGKDILGGSSVSHCLMLSNNGTSARCIATTDTANVIGTGANTRIAFWTGTSSLSSSAGLSWDGTALASAQFNVSAGADSAGADGVGKVTYSSSNGHLRVTGQSGGVTATPANLITENDLASFTGAALGGQRLAFYSGSVSHGFSGGAGITGDPSAGTLVIEAQGSAPCGTYAYLSVCGDGGIPVAVFKQSNNAALPTYVDVSNNGGYMGHLWTGGTSQGGNFFSTGMPYANNFFVFAGDSGMSMWVGTLGASTTLQLGAGNSTGVTVESTKRAVFAGTLKSSAVAVSSTVGGTCTGSPTVVGTNTVGTATGTCIAGQTMTITFGGSGYAVAPTCVSGAATDASATTTVLTISALVALTAAPVEYICVEN